MKVFTLVATAHRETVAVIVQCEDCKTAIGSWEGVVGIVHIPVDDINGDIQDHICGS